MKRIVSLIGVSAAAALVVLIGCGHGDKDGNADGKGDRKKAVAVIDSKSDSQVTGKAVFREDDGKVTLKLEIEGASTGPHAVHLHENGDCSAPDAASAGGHWNPTHEDHGKWVTPPFHRGDIGNVEVGSDGKATFTVTTDLWTIGGDAGTDVVGKAFIVHAAADDLVTQPTGNAGGRVGCGVVKLATK